LSYFCFGLAAVSTFQFPQNVASEMLFDLPVSRDRLAGAGIWILIPIMASAMPQQDAALFFQLSNQFVALHAI
jgi:hypothetical protein